MFFVFSCSFTEAFAFGDKFTNVGFIMTYIFYALSLNDNFSKASGLFLNISIPVTIFQLKTYQWKILLNIWLSLFLKIPLQDRIYISHTDWRKPLAFLITGYKVIILSLEGSLSPKLKACLALCTHHCLYLTIIIPIKRSIRFFITSYGKMVHKNWNNLSLQTKLWGRSWSIRFLWHKPHVLAKLV